MAYRVLWTQDKGKRQSPVVYVRLVPHLHAARCCLKLYPKCEVPKGFVTQSVGLQCQCLKNDIVSSYIFVPKSWEKVQFSAGQNEC